MTMVEDSQEQMEDVGQKTQKESVAEAEQDEEIRALQAGDESRGSSASQSNECCMDPTFLHSFLTTGADLARQQIYVCPKRVRDDRWSAAAAGASHSTGRRGEAEDLRRRGVHGRNGVICNQGNFFFSNFWARMRFFGVLWALTKSTQNIYDNEYHTL